jgi:hypothetical protein
MNGKSLPEGNLVSSPPVRLIDIQLFALALLFIISSVQIKRGRFVDLFSPEMRKTTLMTWFLWFGTAASYYGIILAQSDILERGNICES